MIYRITPREANIERKRLGLPPLPEGDNSSADKATTSATSTAKVWERRRRE